MQNGNTIWNLYQIDSIILCGFDKIVVLFILLSNTCVTLSVKSSLILGENKAAANYV